MRREPAGAQDVAQVIQGKGGDRRAEAVGVDKERP